MADEITKPGGALRLDVNDDGRITITDLPAWLAEIFFLPGDWLIWTTRTYAAPVARFLELGINDYGGVLSGAVSALCWLALTMLAAIALRAVRNFDQVLTMRLCRSYATARLRLRIGVRLLAARLRPLLSRERSAERRDEVLTHSAHVDVGDAELRVLQLHAELGPGYALAGDEVASALALGAHRAGEVLERLVKLQLLRTTVGGCEDQTAYTLTRAGRAYLSFRELG